MLVEKQWKLVQKHVKLCLGEGIEDMAPSQNIISPSKVLERDFVLKNIEGQVRESREQKLSLLSLSWIWGRWRLERWKDLICGESKPQSLCPVRIWRRGRCGCFYSRRWSNGRRNKGINIIEPVRRATIRLLS